MQAVFRSALDFVERVPVRRLTFVPDARVWDCSMICEVSCERDRYVARATNVAARMIGGEMMIMSGLDSSLFSSQRDRLRPLAGGRRRDAARATSSSSASARAFDVDPAVALRDAEELAEDLARHGILRVVGFADARRRCRRSKESP